MAVDQVAVHGNPQRAPVQIECFDDALLRVADGAVHLVGWRIDEGGRKVGKEPLEPSQPLVGRPFLAAFGTTPL